MLEYIILSDFSEEMLSVAKERILRFREETGARARVVSFCDSVPSSFLSSLKIEYWRDIYAGEREAVLLSRTQEALRKIAPALTRYESPALRAHRILLSYYMSMAVALTEVRSASPAPTCFILSGSGAAGPFTFVKGSSADPVPSAPLRITLETTPFRDAMNWARRLKHSLSKSREKAPESKRRVQLVVLDDSGTLLNFTPALGVCEDLRRKSSHPLVVTGSPVVQEKMLKAGFEVWLTSSRSLTQWEWDEISHRVNSMIKVIDETDPADPTPATFASFVQPKLSSWQRDGQLLEEEFASIGQRYQVTGLMTIGTATPLTIAAGEWWQSQGGQWLVYFPVILNPTIELSDPKIPALFAPADKYLVYGEQLRDRLISLGVDAGRINSVGSVTFDLSHGRDRAADISTTRGQILKHWRPGDKLVVVGTECLSDPFIEIEPVVKELLKLPDVHVVIKVHPSDSEEVFQSYARTLGQDSRIEVINACDLVALLHSADLLVCILSNIIITAAVLGTPTLVCDFSQKRAPIDYTSEGLCLGCFDIGDLPRMLRELLAPTETLAKAKDLLRTGIRRFNGPNDGRSSERVAERILGLN